MFKKKESQITSQIKESEEENAIKNRNTNKNSREDIKFSFITITGIKLGFILIFSVVSSMIAIGSLLIMGAGDSYKNITKTVCYYSDQKLERIYNTIEYFDKGNFKETIESITDDKEGIKLIRNCIIKPISEMQSIFFLNKNGTLINVDGIMQRKIQSDTDTYKYMHETLNDMEEKNISNWIYDSPKDAFIKIVSYIMKDKNGNPKGALGLEYALNIKGGALYSFTKMFNDCNLFIVDNEGDVIFKNNKNSKVENRILNNAGIYQIKMQIVNNDTSEEPEDLDEEDESYIVNPKNEKVINENKYDGLFENITGQLFESVQNLDINKMFALSRSNLSTKNNFEMIIEYSDIIYAMLRKIFVIPVIIAIITLLLSYLLSINFDSSKRNLVILGLIYSASIIAAVCIMIYIYTINFEEIRKKEILADGLLINYNIQTDYDMESLINDTLKVLDENSSSSSQTEERINLLTDYLKQNFSGYETFNAQVGISNSKVSDLAGKYKEFYRVYKTKGDIFVELSEDTKTLLVTKYYLQKVGSLDVAIKIDMNINEKYLGIDKLFNDRTPVVYISANNVTYKIKNDQITKTDNITNEFEEKYNDVLEFATIGRQAVASIKDDVLGINYYLFYKINTTPTEAVLLIFVAILNGLSLYFIYKITNAQMGNVNQSFKYETENTILGEVVYMKPNELERSLFLNEEKNKMQDEDYVPYDEVTVKLNNRRQKRNMEILNQNANQEDEFNFDKNDSNSFNVLSLFKMRKNIFADYIALLNKQKNMGRNLNNQGPNIYEGEHEEEIEEEKKEKTLGEALLELQERRSNKKSNHHSMPQSSKLLDSSRDEDFEKTLTSKYKDTKN